MIYHQQKLPLSTYQKTLNKTAVCRRRRGFLPSAALSRCLSHPTCASPVGCLDRESTTGGAGRHPASSIIFPSHPVTRFSLSLLISSSLLSSSSIPSSSSLNGSFFGGISLFHYQTIRFLYSHACNNYNKR